MSPREDSSRVPIAVEEEGTEGEVTVGVVATAEVVAGVDGNL